MSDKGSKDQAQPAKDTKITYFSADKPSVADLIVKGMPGLRISDGKPASVQSIRSSRRTVRPDQLRPECSASVTSPLPPAPIQTSSTSTSTYKSPGLFGGVIQLPLQQRPPPETGFGGKEQLVVFGAQGTKSNPDALEDGEQDKKDTAATKYTVGTSVEDDSNAPAKGRIMDLGKTGFAAGKKLSVLTRAVRVPEALTIDYGDTFVFVRIGQGDHQRTFAVHENLLCASSLRLKKMLSEVPVEHNHKKVPFDYADPGAFALYIQYLYTGHIPSKSTSVTTSNEHTTLCKLYILAYDFENIPAQNAACDAIYAKAMESVGDIQNSLPQCEHIDIIYSSTSSPCAARRLLADLYTAYAKDEWLSAHKETLPQQFVKELALNLMKHRAAWLAHIVGPNQHYHENVGSEQIFETD
ncbi:hypothetical protein BKA63DRAFT_21246 [Paraphoma chrysanthemicola]|nr:hypothetical protein BKA63DRAFT_21246 [Paraphoma chrysanthemicola]